MSLSIDTIGLLLSAQRLPPDKLATAKAEFNAIEDMGIVRKSRSPWASPLHIVNKMDGRLRPWGDFWRLNKVTTCDSYPVPFIADAISFLHGKRIFSKVDLLKTYFHIPIAKRDIPKTAVITPFCLYE